ncbi:excinuclease UvrABC ATPase subunit [Streptomyces achromogenes]|uniref:UvrABC system protein A n=1 Tax=Streptomyces achromogenes TaxID=67255 RepID=A0ABU0QB20_STRAH|nr:hypothetical protein [Streptomyces achromogenes]MDQ0687837.1 excinuclease UvrABC ATPase subunit [Streptomyces achromogenes]
MHDPPQLLREADWLIEIGPGSGTEGGTVLATGDVTTLGKDPHSLIGGFRTGREPVLVRQRADRDTMFDQGRIRGLTAADFSCNTGSLRCPRCEGTGQVSLDVRFLPHVDIACPACDGTRYAPEAAGILRPTPTNPDDGMSLPDLLALTARQAIEQVGDIRRAEPSFPTGPA